MHDFPVRQVVTKGPTRKIWVDRERAAYGSWYEFFPRSTGGTDKKGKPVHGTFATAANELERVADMGFDVVYLPPIHPIGRVNRKGPNNSLTPSKTDVGSPWAIGAKEGGHDAIHPELGSDKDFAAFVQRANDLGMEVALDLALQVAPDHPWVKQHPEFFTTLPDGTIAYAENPPKKYQDIYPLNFDNDRDAIYAEMLRVTCTGSSAASGSSGWTTPTPSRRTSGPWLIEQVKAEHPDVLFLAEAFTRPARLWGLARAGFTQSYTYFTWRTTKAELTEFGEDPPRPLGHRPAQPVRQHADILPEHLQVGGPSMFAIRAALAATLAPTWGVYSGFELYEHEAVRPGSEEYLDSEKYELRPRDFDKALADGESLQPWLTPAQRDPPRAPRAAADAHPALPPHRPRRAAGLLQAGPGDRRHRAGRGLARPARVPRGHDVARPAGAGLRAGDA